MRVLAMRAMLCALAGALGFFAATAASAQSVAEFYRGRQISMIVGFNPGGAYDPYARAVARHLSRHIPGGPAAILLAVERGEVQGMCGFVDTILQQQRPDWLRDRKVRMLIQVGLERNARMGDVPFVMDFAKSEDERGVLRLIFGWTIMGRPFLAPPGLPQARRVALTRAFEETMRDPAFLDEAARQRLEIAPIGGAQIDR